MTLYRLWAATVAFLLPSRTILNVSRHSPGYLKVRSLNFIRQERVSASCETGITNELIDFCFTVSRATISCALIFTRLSPASTSPVIKRGLSSFKREAHLAKTSGNTTTSVKPFLSSTLMRAIFSPLFVLFIRMLLMSPASLTTDLSLIAARSSVVVIANWFITSVNLSRGCPVI